MLLGSAIRSSDFTLLTIDFNSQSGPITALTRKTGKKLNLSSLATGRNWFKLDASSVFLDGV